MIVQKYLIIESNIRTIVIFIQFIFLIIYKDFFFKKIMYFLFLNSIFQRSLYWNMQDFWSLYNFKGKLPMAAIWHNSNPLINSCIIYVAFIKLIGQSILLHSERCVYTRPSPFLLQWQYKLISTWKWNRMSINHNFYVIHDEIRSNVCNVNR